MDLLERGIGAMEDSVDVRRGEFATRHNITINDDNAAAFKSELKSRIADMGRAETLLKAAAELAPPELKTTGLPAEKTKPGSLLEGVKTTIGQAIDESLSGAQYTNALLQKADMCFEGTYKQHLQTQAQELRV